MVPRPSRRPAGAGRRLFCALRAARGRLLGAGAPGGRSALVRSGSPRLQLRRSAPWPFLSFLPWLLASGLACPGGPASASLPPPALCSIVGRPAPGLRAPRGAGVFSLPGLLVGLRASPFPRFWFPPPSVARFLSPVGGRRLRRRSFSYSDGVDLAAPAGGCKDRAEIRCPLGSSLVPCPPSCRYENLKTAIDKQTFVLYYEDTEAEFSY